MLNDGKVYKKAKYMNKLETVFKNQTFFKKSFNSNADF